MKQSLKKTKVDPLVDFRNFMAAIWRFLKLPDPTDIQYDIGNFLQGKDKRIVIQGFRGVGKSWITAAYCLHQLYLNPQKNILVVSASKTRSDDFSTFCLRLLNEVPFLQHLMPTDSQRQSKISFDVKPARASQQPSVKSVGIFGMLTGSRADLLICDDAETPNNSLTTGMRARLSESIKEFDAILKPHGRIIFLGTPQCETSIYNILSKERGFKVRKWISRYPTKKELDEYGETLAPIIRNAVELNIELVGKSTENTRFSDKDLSERELSYGRTGFKLQYQLDTSLADLDRYPLKLKDLIVTSLDPEVAYEKYVWASNPELQHQELPMVGLSGHAYYRPMDTVGEPILYQTTVMSIDPSGRGLDETGFAICKLLNGQIFVHACGGMKGGFEDVVLVKLVKLAKKHKVNKIINESNMGGGMYTQLLKPYLMKEYPCEIEEVHHNIQKERRISDTLESVISSHKLIVDEQVVKDDYASIQNVNESDNQSLKRMLFYQMSRLTRDKGSLAFDDRLDALSMAVGYFAEQMAHDADRAIYERKNDLMSQELDRFMDNAVGYRSKGNTWI